MQQREKLELLIRQNKGRVEHPYYSIELSHILKIDIHPTDILDLQQTDLLFDLHQAQSVRGNEEKDFGFKKVWRYEPKTTWVCLCDCLKEKLLNEAAVLFAGPFEFCGGLKIHADCVLSEVCGVKKSAIRREGPD